MYVQHYLAMKLERDVRIGELFREYKEWIERKKPFPNVESELREFVHHAGSFAVLVRGETTSVAGAFGARLAAMDIGSAYPLIIGLIGLTNVPVKELEGILLDLESFLVRRMICQRQTKSYTRKCLDLLREFRAGGVLTRKAFQDLLLAGGTDPVFDWPTDEQFKAAWTTVDAYVVLKPIRVEMVLRRIEEAMRSPQSEPQPLASRLTVEHVMPQKWEANWPLPSGVDEEKAREAREEVIHDFGNLTLITQSLNSTLSNGPAEKKFAAVLEHSNLQLSKTFNGRKTWTEDDVRERGRALFDVALKVWPRPAS